MWYAGYLSFKFFILLVYLQTLTWKSYFYPLELWILIFSKDNYFTSNREDLRSSLFFSFALSKVAGVWWFIIPSLVWNSWKYLTDVRLNTMTKLHLMCNLSITFHRVLFAQCIHSYFCDYFCCSYWYDINYSEEYKFKIYCYKIFSYSSSSLRRCSVFQK